MATNLNQIPSSIFAQTGDVPNVKFAQWYNTQLKKWVDYKATLPFPWRNANKVERPWLRGNTATWDYYDIELGSDGGSTRFRVPK